MYSFFGTRSPSKLVYIGAKGAFRKILESVGQKWIKKYQRRDPLGRQGVETLRGRHFSTLAFFLSILATSLRFFLFLSEKFCALRLF